MTVRSTRSTVTFTAPFRLAGFDALQPAGTYDVDTEEEAIEGNALTVYRRVATLLYLRDGGTTRTMTVDPRELEAALAADRAQ